MAGRHGNKGLSQNMSCRRYAVYGRWHPVDIVLTHLVFQVDEYWTNSWDTSKLGICLPRETG